MKRIFLIMNAILVIVLASCTNDQLQDAIESCKGDEECYSIIDDAINDELESRGIQSGAMTNRELESVITVVDSLKADFFGTDLNAYTDSELNEIGSFYSMINHVGRLNDLDDSVSSFLDSQGQLYRFKLDVLLENETQFLLIDEAKHLIYKESNDRYVYEIQTAQFTQEYTIDLSFGSIIGLPGTVTVEEFNEFIGSQDTIIFDENSFRYFVKYESNIYIGYMDSTKVATIFIEGYSIMSFSSMSLDGGHSIDVQVSCEDNVCSFEDPILETTFALNIESIKFFTESLDNVGDLTSFFNYLEANVTDQDLIPTN